MSSTRWPTSRTHSTSKILSEVVSFQQAALKQQSDGQRFIIVARLCFAVGNIVTANRAEVVSADTSTKPARKTDSTQKTRMNYPIAKKVDQVDDYHAVKVADPYRWLENPDAEDTRAWVEAENKVTFDFLDQISERAKIKERLTQLWNFERFDIPFKEGASGAERYFYFKNDGLQNQNVLYT